MKKRTLKRFMTGSLAVLLAVTMNINPIATLAGAVADSGLVDKLGNFKDHLLYVADVNNNTVYAADGESDPGCDCDVTINCDHKDAIKALMEATRDDLSDGTSLKDINDNISNQFTTITGYIDGLEEGQADLLAALGYGGEDATHTLSGDVSDIKDSLGNIENALVGIQASIENQQHAYFVAHLYSLNNSMPNALYRPFTDEVPYVADFATVWGKFANVYTGYWDTAVTEPTSNKWWRQTYSTGNANDFIYNWDRYATVLGDDIIIAQEGIVNQTNVVKPNQADKYIGLAGANYFAGDLSDAQPNSILALEQKEIGTDVISWLDAVTVLYKAMGQEYYTYQSYMSYDSSITPEHSPAFQNLSNPAPNPEGSPHVYNGYNVYFFTTRANPIKADLDKDGKTQANNVYWSKALKDGFIPSTLDRKTGFDEPIIASDFWKLAEDIMSAYGEKYINDDEVRALLQVYGSEYPVQLGYEVADAWAYLKVRGCLECPMNAADNVSRAQLLDVAARIKDDSFRGDYKVITVTLDLSDVMQDSGYYPVFDLATSTNSFSTEVTYDYTQYSYYTYLLPYYTDETNLGNIGDFRIYKKQEKSDSAAMDENKYTVNTMVINDKQYLRVDVDKEYTGNIWISKTTYGDTSQTPNGTVDWICIPSSALGGGVFSTMNTTDKVTTFKWENDEQVKSFTEYKNVESMLSCNDYKRAGDDKPVGTEVAANATLADHVIATLNEWTSPITAYAALGQTTNGTATTVNIRWTDSTNNATIVDTSLAAAGTNTITNKISDTTVVGSSGKIYKNLDETAEIYAAPDDTIIQDLYRAKLLLDCLPLNNATRYIGTDYGFQDLKNDLKSMAVVLDSGDSNAISGASSGMKTAGYKPAAAAYLGEYLFSSNTPTSYSYITNDIYVYGNNGAGGHWETERKTQKYNTAQILLAWKYNIYLSSSENTLKSYRDYGQTSSHVQTWLFNEGIFEMNGSGKTSTRTNYESSVDDWITFFGNDFTKEDIMNARRWIDSYKATKITRTNLGISINTTMGGDILAAFDRGDIGQIHALQEQASNTETRLDLPTTVSSDAIMKKDQQILLKWSDLVQAGYVIAEDTGKLPTLQKDGALYFFTKNGQVKVNNTKHTIQIGTTLYDLSHSNDESPELYYFDNDQNELYIDYRCVLGVVRDKIKYDDVEHCSKLEGNALGSGNAVVYDLGSANRSNAYNIKSVLTYNFPDIPDSHVGTNVLSNVSGYPVDVVISTRYDGGETGNGTAVYWDDSCYDKAVRMSMSSFVPTANWLTVIRQTSYAEEDTESYLFIWYPIEPFINGFTEDGTNIKTISENANEKAEYYANYTERVTNASASRSSKVSLKNALTAAYPDWETTDKWYVQMSCAALAKLYEMTGSYYASGDYVVRQVCLTNTSPYSAVNIFTGEQPENGCVANNPGTIYWVQSMGYVYNIPTVDDFTLSDYFGGKYLLPLAVDMNGAIMTQPSLVNYNVSYYGNYATLSNGVWNYDNKVVYGNVLSGKGIINYKSLSTIVPLSDLPNKDRTDGAPDATPVLFEGSGEPAAANHNNVYQPAPAGVYIYFGSSPLEEQTLKGISQYASYKNAVYYGTSQLEVVSSQAGSTNVTINVFGSKYCSFEINANSLAHRTLHTSARDVLILEPSNIQKSDLNGVVEIASDDAPTNEILDWLKGLGTNDLLTAIDNGSTWMILIAFKVLPWIGIILMTILVGLAFLADTKIFRVICEKTFDPIRILTFGGRDIDHWHWKKVLIPCIILFTAFALFLNGNIIRIIMWGAEWWGVAIRWFKNI